MYNIWQQHRHISWLYMFFSCKKMICWKQVKKINISKENSYNLLKRLISFKNKKTLSIGTSLNNCLIVSTWKYLFLMLFWCRKRLFWHRCRKHLWWDRCDGVDVIHTFIPKIKVVLRVVFMKLTFRWLQTGLSDSGLRLYDRSDAKL